MSTVQEIRDAIAKLPDNEFLESADWMGEQQNWNVESDPEILASILRAEKELDEGKGISLEEVRKLTRTWTTK